MSQDDLKSVGKKESTSFKELSSLEKDLEYALSERLDLRRALLIEKNVKPHLMRLNRRKIARLKCALHQQSAVRG